MTALTCSGLRKVYPGKPDVVALEGIDLAIPPGAFVALLGPSGCGKSTLLNLVAGFEAPSAGSLRVFGETPTQPGPDRAVVFQEPALFPWLRIWENVTFSPRLAGKPSADYEAEARRVLDLVGLTGFERHYPDQLSGGMKQRVGLARCLLMQPRLFLMDEPFGALDAQTRLAMQELLLQVWDSLKRTVLFITHDIDEAIFLADKVYVMSPRPGRIKASFEIDLPRPRSIEILADPNFNQMKKSILHSLRS